MSNSFPLGAEAPADSFSARHGWSPYDRIATSKEITGRHGLDKMCNTWTLLVAELQFSTHHPFPAIRPSQEIWRSFASEWALIPEILPDLSLHFSFVPNRGFTISSRSSYER